MSSLSPTSIYLANSTDIRPTELTVLTQYQEPFGLKVFRCFIFAFLVLASLVGNAVVIKAVFENSLRKPLTHYLVSNMAVAELIGTILVPFTYSYQEILYWPFGELLCHIIGPLHVLSVLVTTTSLAAIAVHRYKVFATTQRGRMSYRSIVIIVIIIWTIALAITFPSFLFHTRVSSPSKTFWCLELFPGDKLSEFPSQQLKKYYMIRFICNYVIPICTMSFAYGIVSIKLRFHRNRSIRDVETELGSDKTQDTNASNQGSGSAETPQDAHSPQAPNNCRAARHGRERRKRKAISELETDLLKMIYAIILICLVCYFPYQIFFLLEYFGILHFTTWRYFDVTRVYVFLLTCFPSALHPMCYGTMSKFFARTFSRLVLCRWSQGSNS